AWTCSADAAGAAPLDRPVRAGRVEGVVIDLQQAVDAVETGRAAPNRSCPGVPRPQRGADRGAQTEAAVVKRTDGSGTKVGRPYDYRHLTVARARPGLASRQNER